MARRRYNNPYIRNWGNAAPPPIVNVAPVAVLEGLATAYSWMGVDKAIGFKLAFEWYSANTMALLFGDPLDEARQKSYDRAIKSKAQGDSEYAIGNPEAGYNAWSMALHLFEKIWASKNLPKLDNALNAASVPPEVRSILTVLENLNQAYTPYARFRVTFNPAREFLAGEILIPRQELNQMVGLPPLKAVLGEIPTVAKVISLVPGPDGVSRLDGALFLQNFSVLSTQVSDWAVQNKAVLRPVGKPAKTAKAPVPGAPAAPKAPRNPRAKLPDSTVLHLTGRFCTMKGKRLTVVQLVQEGMTVKDLKAAATQAFAQDHTWSEARTLEVLNAAIQANLVTI